ncbi:MAG: sigma-70 family RNA polymerase sigma factor [Pseudomonadota bacterium]
MGTKSKRLAERSGGAYGGRARKTAPARPPVVVAEDAVNALYRDYFSQLSATLRRMYGDGPPDPEDVAQEAFKRVVARGDLGAIKNLKAFIWSTARNIVFKSHRTHETRSKYDFEVEEVLFPLSTDKLTPERVILAREQLRAINDLLGRMPENRRRALLLHRVEGLSISEVSRRMGLSYAAVYEHIKRGAADIALWLLENETAGSE